MRKDLLAAALTAAAMGTASTFALAAPPSIAPDQSVPPIAGCVPAADCPARLILAGGPPPWAPAHGYRRKRGHKHEHHHYYYDDDDHDHYEHDHHVAVPDVGIELGRCNRELIGGILGGVTGGVVGSQVSKGPTRTAVTIGGTIVGVLIGGAIGRSMDQADQACVAHTLEQAPPGHAVTWSDSGNRHYRVVALESYADARGRTCREYRTTATIGGRNQQIYGTACRDADGNWQRMS